MSGRLTILHLAIGLLAAAGLFLASAAVQPAALADHPAEIDQAWAMLRSLPPPEPVVTPDRLKPPAAPPPRDAAAAKLLPLAVISRPRPASPAPTSRPVLLTSRHEIPQIDPLLQGISLSPEGMGSFSLDAAQNGTALSAAGDGHNSGWLHTADTRTLSALEGLWDRHGAQRPASHRAQQPQWLTRIEPEYPADALQANREGEVQLNLLVLANGTVGDVEVSSFQNDAAFARSAVEAARRSTFVPGRDEKGTVSDQWVKVTYRFQLK